MCEYLDIFEPAFDDFDFNKIKITDVKNNTENNII